MASSIPASALFNELSPSEAVNVTLLWEYDMLTKAALKPPIRTTTIRAMSRALPRELWGFNMTNLL